MGKDSGEDEDEDDVDEGEEVVGLGFVLVHGELGAD